MRKLVIFDFDGTLVDTLTDVSICFNEALAVNDMPVHPLEEYSNHVGGNLETIVSNILPPDKVTEVNIDLVKSSYRKIYSQSSKPNTKIYPGIMDCLYTLKNNGYKLAVNSNKGQVLLDEMVSDMFPDNFFDSVIGYLEERPSKPDPLGVDMICSECGCMRDDAVYVGDGKSDVRTAENAGIPCIFVLWNKSNEHTFNVYKTVRNADELKEVLLGEIDDFK